MHGFFSEIMVNAENIFLVETFQQNPVELLRGGEVGTERFFHDDSRAFLSAAGFSELIHNRSEQYRRNGEVMRRSQRRAEFLADGLKSRRIIVVTVHITQQTGKLFKSRLVKSAVFFKAVLYP